MKKTILALTLALSLQGLAAASAADNDYIMCPGDQPVQYGPRRTRYVTGINYRISLIDCIKASISFGKISPILPIRNVSASEILPG